MSELITSRIAAHATRLGLPDLAENLELLVERAEADSMGYREFIDTVLGEAVADDRDLRQIERIEQPDEMRDQAW